MDVAADNCVTIFGYLFNPVRGLVYKEPFHPRERDFPVVETGAHAVVTVVISPDVDNLSAKHCLPISGWSSGSPHAPVPALVAEVTDMVHNVAFCNSGIPIANQSAVHAFRGIFPGFIGHPTVFLGPVSVFQPRSLAVGCDVRVAKVYVC